MWLNKDYSFSLLPNSQHLNLIEQPWDALERVRCTLWLIWALWVASWSLWLVLECLKEVCSDWDLGNFKAILVPWALCHMPKSYLIFHAINKQNRFQHVNFYWTTWTLNIHLSRINSQINHTKLIGSQLYKLNVRLWLMETTRVLPVCQTPLCRITPTHQLK